MGKRNRKSSTIPAPGTVSDKPIQSTAAVKRCAGFALLLFLITLTAYAPARFCGFVNYDDNDYVTSNSQVKSGLSWEGMKWALTTGAAANWHPLTWMSHMLDVQLYGLDPEYHHLTNVVLHLANTLLLFWVLVKLTEAAGRSAIIAALFAVHPLHVESVAWVAERKDVLSTFLWMLTMLAYVAYVRRPKSLTYFTVLGLFAAGLMAKPMLVTLPLVLFLLDFWPLRRWTWTDRTQFGSLIREKVPFLALSLGSSIITFIVQQKGRAVIGLNRIPIGYRVENAFLSYFVYIRRMFWPDGLSVLYPVTLTVSGWWVVGALGVVSMSIVAVWLVERRPYVFVGWFWYLITLIPVIGLVQVGKQASADRYTYLPLIGLFLIIAYGVHDVLKWKPALRTMAVALAGVGLFVCVWLTRKQLEYWRNSQALWQHALALDDENASAHVNIGSDLADRGRFDEAIPHYWKALQVEPEMAVAHSDLAAALEHRGQLDDAIKHYSEALRIGPEAAEWDFNFANALVKSGKPENLDEAIRRVNQAFRIKPNFPEARNVLGICYLTQGQFDKAVSEFSTAIQLKPDDASAHNNLATALGQLDRIDEAVSEYAAAVRLDPNYIDARENLGILLARQGKRNEALEQFSTVLRLSPGDEVARGWLARLSGSGTTAVRN